MAIDRVIKEDSSVADDVKYLKLSKKELDKVEKEGLLSPSDKSVNRILQYAIKGKQ